MSIAIARMKDSIYKYEVTALSHIGEIRDGVARTSHAVQTGEIVSDKSLILLLGGHSILLSQIDAANRFTVVGFNDNSGGVMSRPTEVIRVGAREFYAGHGLLLLGLLSIEDLMARQESIPQISGDAIQRGSW